MKGMDIVFTVRPLDNSGVSESSTLETTDINKAIVTTQTLLKDPLKKYIIVASTDLDCQD